MPKDGGKDSSLFAIGRPTKWNDGALLVVFLEVEIGLRRLRVRQPSAAYIKRLCFRLLAAGAFQPLEGNGSARATNAETLRAKYYVARKWQASLPQGVRDRHERMITKSAARRSSREVGPNIVASKLHNRIRHGDAGR